MRTFLCSLFISILCAASSSTAAENLIKPIPDSAMNLWMMLPSGETKVCTVGSPELHVNGGALTIDLRKYPHITTGVVCIPLYTEKLQADAEYLFSSVVSRDVGGSIITLYPEADWSKPLTDTPGANSAWHSVGGNTPIQGEFCYRPGINNEHCGFYLSPEQAGHVITIRDLSVTLLP